MLKVPHPVILQLMEDVPCPPVRPEDSCRWGKKLRIKLRGEIDKIACGGQVPVSVTDSEGGETWDQKGYMKALQEMYMWTYGICELQSREEGGYMASNAPRSCRDDRYC